MTANSHKGNILKVKPHARLMHWYRWQPYRFPMFNEVARTMMQIKYAVEKAMVQQKSKSTELNFEEYLAGKNVFIGLCTFRSGSTFLADLFSKTIPQSQIEHEPNVNDYWNYPRVLRNEQEAFDYITRYRKNEFLQRLKKPETTQVYGEFNPFFVLHVNAIQQLMPGVKVFQLVRDGRDVVRSLMAREVLGDKDPLDKIIQPPKNDPYFEQWSAMDRFAKVCWKWRYENQQLRTYVSHRVHFESFISDYDYFKEHLLDYLGVDIPIEAWQNHISQPVHASPKHRIPNWQNWSVEQRNTFDEICGEEMRAHGYY